MTCCGGGGRRGLRLLFVSILIVRACGNELAPWQRAVSACAGYFVAQIASTPLEVIKTRVQTRSLEGPLVVVRNIARTEGIFGFYRGFGATMLMMPGAILQYSIYDQIRYQAPEVPSILVALCAGLCDITVRCPFEKFKTVAQAKVGTIKSPLTRSKLAPSTIKDLWRGYGAQLARDLPYVVIYWQALDFFKDVLKVDEAVSQREKLSRNFVSGVLAGAVAATLVTPADVIKTRVQISSSLSPLAAARSIISSQGPAALFAGLPLRLVRIPVYTGVIIASFEFAKDFFLDSSLPSFAQSSN